jgi:exopolyphosphatase/guanosine-5'-triphosphate,3'-diphosphate pyrophosphatase
MTSNLASIDIGSHTARLLVAEKLAAPELLRPLVRKRAYIRLAEGFNRSERKIIHSDAIERTLSVLKDFLHCIETSNVHSVHAVATGVVREAANRDEFLNRIYATTGICVRALTGNEEALLTGKGVLYALDIRTSPFLIFDLGGGSTEFFFDNMDGPTVSSILLGAMILTHEYMKSDPPQEKELDALTKHVDRSLQEAHVEAVNDAEQRIIVGTGGTVTTLAAMVHRVPLENITPERMNGLILKRQELETLFGKISNLSFDERVRLPGLEPGRADVIVAGSLIIIRMLHFLRSLQLVVSVSDLLEGILIDCFKGEKNG